MQVGIRGQTGTTDISGIPVDFRRNQNNVALYLVAAAMEWDIIQFFGN
jgi:hypothetical protein